MLERDESTYRRTGHSLHNELPDVGRFEEADDETMRLARIARLAAYLNHCRQLGEVLATYGDVGKKHLAGDGLDLQFYCERIAELLERELGDDFRRAYDRLLDG